MRLTEDTLAQGPATFWIHNMNKKVSENCPLKGRCSSTEQYKAGKDVHKHRMNGSKSLIMQLLT